MLPLIMVRLLTPAEVGYYKIFYLYLMALPFLFMAGGPTNSVFFWVGKEDEHKSHALNATWIWTIILSSLIFMIGYPLRELISEKLNLPVDYVVTMLIAGSLWCPSCHYTESSIAHGKPGRGSLFDTFFEVTKTIGFIAIAWNLRNIKYIFIFHPFMMFTKLLIGSYLNRKENDVSFKTSSSSMTSVFKYFFPVSFAGCLSFFVDKADLLILSGVLDASAFAFYSMGCLIIPPLFLLEMSVQKVLIPALSKAFTNKDWLGGAEHYRKAVNDISFLIIPGVFGLITFATPIVKLLYTEEYLESAVYLRVFALSYLLCIFPHDSAARASGQTKWILKMYVVMAPISLVIGYYSASYWGAMGILTMSLFLKAIPKFCGLHYSKSIMHWSWKEMFPAERLMKYGLLSSALSVLSIVSKNFFATDMHWFFVCAPVFAIIYLGLLNFPALGNLGRKYVYRT